VEIENIPVEKKGRETGSRGYGLVIFSNLQTGGKKLSRRGHQSKKWENGGTESPLFSIEMGIPKRRIEEKKRT